MKKLIAVAELAAERGKPIVLIKIGRSESGTQAARSHTAALTGVDALNDAMFRQYGIIRVQDYDELLETSQLLANIKQAAQARHRRRVALGRHQLAHRRHDGPRRPHPAGALRARARRHQRDPEGLRLGGESCGRHRVSRAAIRFPQIMDYMIEEPDVGTLVVASAGMGKQVEQVIALRDRTDKNVAFFWTASRLDKGPLAELKSANIPIFYTPDKLARGLKSLLDYHDWRDRRLAAPSRRRRGPPRSRSRR